MLSFKRIAAIFAFSLLVATASAQQIRITSGERWYGIDSDTLTTIDSQNTMGGASFLISNKGRYLYSKEPFKATIGSQTITLDKDVRAQNGGKSLREAYLYCFHRNFYAEGATIATELYSQPIYDMRGRSQYLRLNGDIASIADDILAAGWPTGIILLGDEWQTLLGSYTLDAQYYKQLREQVESLHSKGFKVIISLTPYVSASGRTFNSYSANNLLLLDPATDRPLIVRSQGIGMAAVYNINAPGAKENMTQRINALLSQCSFDGIFTDSGLAADGSLNPEAESLISNWNALCELAPLELNIKSSHAGHYEPSISTYTYDQIISGNDYLTNYLTKGFMFMPFNAEALSGGRGLNDISYAAKYLQYISHKAMFMVPFLPSELTDLAAREQCTSIIKMRAELNSYILECIEESLLTGEPLLRSLEYMFPRQGFYDCLDQYMLGSRYLVVPPKDEQSTRTVRFPRGNWYSPSGEQIKGPVVRSVTAEEGSTIYYSNQRR